jgi:hypothetical protein
MPCRPKRYRNVFYSGPTNEFNPSELSRDASLLHTSFRWSSNGTTTPSASRKKPNDHGIEKNPAADGLTPGQVIAAGLTAYVPKVLPSSQSLSVKLGRRYFKCPADSVNGCGRQDMGSIDGHCTGQAKIVLEDTAVAGSGGAWEYNTIATFTSRFDREHTNRFSSTAPAAWRGVRAPFGVSNEDDRLYLARIALSGAKYDTPHPATVKCRRQDAVDMHKQTPEEATEETLVPGMAAPSFGRHKFPLQHLR